MHRGYVKIYRKVFDTDMHKDHATFVLWCWLLANATHKARQQMVGASVVELKPGQLVTGREKLAATIGVTSRKIRTILKTLKNRKMVTIKATNKYSIITIVNWALYQGGFQEATSRPTRKVTSKRPASDQQEATNKNDKNIEHVEEAVEEAFRHHLETLRKELSPKAAIDAVYAAHPAFKRLNRISIAQSLETQTDRMRWPEAIEGLRIRYAGAELPQPNKTLRNWLAGKPSDHQSQDTNALKGYASHE